MNKAKKPFKSNKGAVHPPLKPAHPDTKGAPNNQDPNAQYENKDGS